METPGGLGLPASVDSGLAGALLGRQLAGGVYLVRQVPLILAIPDVLLTRGSASTPGTRSARSASDRLDGLLPRRVETFTGHQARQERKAYDGIFDLLREPIQDRRGDTLKESD